MPNQTRKKQATTPAARPSREKANKPDEKSAQLSANTINDQDQLMTTDHGTRINDDQNSLKAGPRGSTLLEDFILREKITHFDHERIPERVVHARGSAAHGVFKVYEPLSKFTKAGFLNDTERETPVFVRFSTVAGSRGSTDLARDVRGFAVKFYTQEGNFDLVGNNMPVFFIQDAIKFPDLIHAVKPEPDNEIPQAASAHDTFWDFISLMPESAHMIMWLMSDRAIPRSYRMMEGFGVHTFRLINENDESSFVKFHWKPLLGVHSVAWDEAQKISGKDPDFHRRDLWEAIEAGDFPEWELGVQIVPEADEHKFPFDLLDPTKIIPEEMVPVQRVGKLTLNRNPDNFFAETEQVAFHIGNIVPGIDFTNDPLLQGRLFSYLDTQLIRLGGPNFHEIPINRPIVPVHNNHRDGFMRQTINRGQASYHPNSLGGGCPFQAGKMQAGFTSHAERVDAAKVRERSPSFMDHFSQAKLFFNSQSDEEKNHIIDAFSFELGKVKASAVRERMLSVLYNVDQGLASAVSFKIGVHVNKHPDLLNFSFGADTDPQSVQPIMIDQDLLPERSEALSMANTIKNSIQTRKIAFLLADGFDFASMEDMKKTLERGGGVIHMIAPQQGPVTAENGEEIMVAHSFLTDASVLYDAVYVPGGGNSVATLEAEADAVHFLNEAWKHCKAIAGHPDAMQLFESTYFFKKIQNDNGVLIGNPEDIGEAFVMAIAQHRFWEREKPMKVPA